MRRILLSLACVVGLLVGPYLTVVHAALSDNLVAFWSLNNTLNDEHSGGYTLTNNNSTPLNGTGHVYANAAEFTDTSSHNLTRANNTDIGSCDCDFTVSAWVNLDDKDNTRDIGGAGTSGGIAWRLRYSLGSDRWAFTTSSATGDANATAVTDGGGFGGGNAPSVSTYYLVIAWHDATNNLIGIATSSNSLTAYTEAYTFGVWDSGGTFTIGAGNTDYFPSYMNGRIGPVMMWKRVLTSQDRTDLFNAGAGVTYAAMTAGGGAAPCMLTLLGVGRC